MKRTALIAAVLMIAGCTQHSHTFIGDAPLYPDYRDVTVPVGIAPLNFEWAEGSPVTTFTAGDVSTRVNGRKVSIRPARWAALTEAAKGGAIDVKADNGQSWKIYVSEDEIDGALAYRLIEPGYEVWSKMGIYMRDLSSYKERALLENTEFEGCVNCHESSPADPSKWSMHIRGSHGATLLQSEKLMDAYNTKTDSTIGSCVYPYWHPSQRYIAYSTNSTHQAFHVLKDKLVEVFDLASDVQVYDTRDNRLISAPQINTGDWETFPSFSPDGKTLYFCKASARQIPQETSWVRYNLYRVSFDPEAGRVGDDIECLVDAESEDKSISFPKPSYDGKYIMYTLSDYGNFSIWHHEADLWLLDLRTGESRRLDEVNSPDTESYHNWSSNSRWFLFSSRRDDGLFTRIYLAHIDADGHVGKPFMLPQKDPAKYYAELFRSYNVPEFVTGPTEFKRLEAVRKINSSKRTQFGL